MVTYSISDVEKLSGVKAHTIRIWEKRYGIIPNRRTNTNIRFYSAEDLQNILNIALLNKKGIKISQIARLSGEEIKQKVATLCDVDEVFEDQIDSLMLAMMELNEFKFLKILDHYIEVRDFETTMGEIIYPFLDKLSVMWVTGSIRGVHESFVTNIIHRKLCIEIDKLSHETDKSRSKYLIYLPENEGHELSILFLYYIIRAKGANVLFLGAGITFEEVIDAYHIFKPDFVFTLFNDSFAESPLQPYLERLLTSMPDCTKVGISGYQTIMQNIKNSERLMVFDDLGQIKSFISQNIQRKD